MTRNIHCLVRLEPYFVVIIGTNTKPNFVKLIEYLVLMNDLISQPQCRFARRTLIKDKLNSADISVFLTVFLCAGVRGMNAVVFREN